MTSEEPGLAALSSLRDPVRRRLYEFVCGRGEPVGRDEAAAAAGIGRPLAAYHLDKLVGLGLLTASSERQLGRRGPGAGRPAKLYARAGGEFTVSVPPREYELAARLLATAVEADRDGACRTALLDAATHLGEDLGRGQGACPGGTDAGRALVAILRAHGFEPWLDSGGDVRLHNCPFHQLAARHPSLVCGMNLALVKGLAASLGRDVLHPVLDPQPGCCCVVIGTSPPAGTARRPALP